MPKNAAVELDMIAALQPSTREGLTGLKKIRPKRQRPTA